MNRVRILLITGVFLALLTGVTGAVYADSRVEEYRLKAAFLLNFPKFTQWPKGVFRNESSPFIVGVLGENPFGGSLGQWEGKTIGGRTVQIKYFPDENAFDYCHVLFICGSEAPVVDAFLVRRHDMPILLVSDIPDFARRGGHIQLFTRQNKIRFAVNLTTLQHAELVLSSKLLQLAEKVEGR